MHKAVAKCRLEVHEPCNLVFHLALEMTINLHFAASEELAAQPMPFQYKFAVNA
jgi:hypothetical protein